VQGDDVEWQYVSCTAEVVESWGLVEMLVHDYNVHENIKGYVPVVVGARYQGADRKTIKEVFEEKIDVEVKLPQLDFFEKEDTAAKEQISGAFTVTGGDYIWDRLQSFGNYFSNKYHKIMGSDGKTAIGFDTYFTVENLWLAPKTVDEPTMIATFFYNDIMLPKDMSPDTIKEA